MAKFEHRTPTPGPEPKGMESVRGIGRGGWPQAIRRNLRSVVAVATLIGSVATVGVIAATSTAGAAAVSNTYSCTADGVTAPSTYSFSSNAPSSVAPGGTYTDVISEGSVAVPATESELGMVVTVTSETGIVNVFTVPTGTSLSGTAALSGGSGLGSTPTISQTGSTVTETIPGPVAGGSSYTAPTVSLPLTVTASAGATIADAFPSITPLANIVLPGPPPTPISGVSTACVPAASPATFDSTSVASATTTTTTGGTTTTTTGGTTTTTSPTTTTTTPGSPTPTCVYGAGSTSPTVLTGVATGGSIAISCTGLSTLAGYSVFLQSPLAAIAGVPRTGTNNEDGISGGQTAAGLSSVSGALSISYTAPVTFAAADTNAACPPTQAQINVGLVACSVIVENAAGTIVSSEPITFTGQPTPANPTLSATVSSIADGGTITLSDASSPAGYWWGNPTAAESIPAADVTVGGVAVASSTLSVSAARYNTGTGAITPPALSGTVTLSPSSPAGAQTVTVAEPDLTGVSGNGTASLAGDVVATLPLTVTGTPVAPTPPTTTPAPPVAPSSQGYWTVSATGSVEAFGNAVNYGGIPSNTRLNMPIVGIAPTVDHKGYWLVGADGGVFTYGDAAYLGSEGGKNLNASIIGIAADLSGGGYWLVASDGGVFTFGNAPFLGSEGGKNLNKSVVGMVTTINGGGYWLVASDGGVFTFGNASFLGSRGGQPINRAIVAMVAAPDGRGYWLLGADGGVFTYGDAKYRGSTGATPPPTNMLTAALTPDDAGYWMMDAAGTVFAYGDAQNLGSATTAYGTPVSLVAD